MTKKCAPIAAAVLFCLAATHTIAAQDPPTVTAEQFDGWMTDLNNWGRWGEDDRLGALNLITPEKRKAAAALVRDGVAVSLAHELLTERAPDNGRPLEHTMIDTGSSPWTVDELKILYHGLGHTHMDALCHVSYKGDFYNGVKRRDVTSEGCPRLGIDAVSGGVFTRGVLIDMAWLKGVDYLEPGTPVTLDDLVAWEEKTGVVVQPGDAVLLRTGRWARRAREGPWGGRFAGFHASCIPWLKERDIAVLGTDAGLDVMPSVIEGAQGISPIHMFVLVALGANVLDVGDFEQLSTEAQKRNRWEFLLTFAPMRVVGGTGSPLNPIAIF